MSMKKEIGVAAITNWAETLFAYLLAFIATPIIVHSFGNIRYGIWAIAMSVTGFYGILDIGLRTTVVRYFAHYAEKKDYQANNILISSMLLTIFFILPIVGSAAALIIGYVGDIFNIPKELLAETRILFGIVALSFCFNATGNIFRGVIVGLRKFVMRNSIMAIFSALRSISIIIILKSGHGLIAAGIVVLCVDLIMNATIVICAFKLWPQLKVSPTLIDLKWMRDVYKFAFFNFLRQVSIRVMKRSNIILIGILIDVKMAAFYAIAESLIRYIEKFPKGLRVTLLPYSSKLDAGGQKDKINQMALAIPKYTFSFFLITILMAVLFGRQFIHLWMGSGYKLSYELLLILLAVETISYSQSMLAHIIVGMGYNRFFGILGIIELSINLPVCIALGKIYGVHGIAFGSLFTVLITSGILIPFYAIHKVEIKILKYYTATMIIPLALSGFIYYINAVLIRIDSFLWVPLVVIEFVVLNYFFSWKEIRFKNGNLKFSF